MPTFLQSFFLFEKENTFYLVMYQCLNDNSYSIKVYNTITPSLETEPLLHTSNKQEPSEWQAKQILVKALAQ